MTLLILHEASGTSVAPTAVSRIVLSNGPLSIYLSLSLALSVASQACVFGSPTRRLSCLFVYLRSGKQTLCVCVCPVLTSVGPAEGRPRGAGLSVGSQLTLQIAVPLVLCMQHIERF